MAEAFLHDPSDVLDYYVDLTDWLSTGDYVSSCAWTVPSPLVKDSEANTNTHCVVWVSGTGVVGTTYTLVCHFVTNDGRESQRSVELKCQER